MTPASLVLVKQLIALLPSSGASEIEVSEGGVRVRITASGAATPAPMLAPMPVLPLAATPIEAANPAVESADMLVKATMHGIFHRASAPGAEPYVQPGAKVTKGQQLCIMEAMKVFNPVTASRDGVISEILAENGQEVALGQALFRIVAA